MQSVCLLNVFCVRTCSTVGAAQYIINCSPLSILNNSIAHYIYIQKAFSLDDGVNEPWQESTSRDGRMSLSRYSWECKIKQKTPFYHGEKLFDKSKKKPFLNISFIVLKTTFDAHMTTDKQNSSAIY